MTPQKIYRYLFLLKSGSRVDNTRLSVFLFRSYKRISTSYSFLRPYHRIPSGFPWKSIRFKSRFHDFIYRYNDESLIQLIAQVNRDFGNSSVSSSMHADMEASKRGLKKINQGIRWNNTIKNVSFSIWQYVVKLLKCIPKCR